MIVYHLENANEMLSTPHLDSMILVHQKIASADIRDTMATDTLIYTSF